MATRLRDGSFKLDMDVVKENLVRELDSLDGRERLMQAMKELQVAVYVMAGGGMLGSSAAQQPSGFYVDSRCSKRPYATRKIKQATDVLHLYAEVLELKEPLEFRTLFHHCGVF